MHTVQAVFFDFDGVLADTEPLHFRYFAEVASGYGVACSWEHYRTRYIGYDDRDLFRAAFRDGGKVLDEALLRACVEQKAVAFAEGWWRLPPSAFT